MDIKAIPTEYKGVRFDSKSEAVFARLLDLQGIDWEHQHPIRHEGHDWDFLIWLESELLFTAFPNGNNVDVGCKTFSRTGKRACLIELKPSRPTTSYVERLKKGMLTGQRESRWIVWGNPWQASEDFTYAFNELCFEGRPSDSILGLSAGFYGFDDEFRISEAKSYRFDLQDTNAICVARFSDAKESLWQVQEPKATPLEQWRASISRLCKLRNDVGMLSDFAMMAQVVNVQGNDWTVVFPPGCQRCLEFCQYRKPLLAAALSEYLAIKTFQLKLGFTLQLSQQQEEDRLDYTQKEVEPSVELIAYHLEPHRIERLKDVVDYIRRCNPDILSRIASLEDHEGDLTCVWNIKRHFPGAGKTTVENAWESVGELECNVTHEYPNNR